MRIDRASPVPLYYQLKQILQNQIDSGELKPGDIFPTENHLQEIYNVSRTTVRLALSELEAEGKIARYRGRGTFVARPKISHNPEQYPNLSDPLGERGGRPGWRLLSAEWVPASAYIAEQLKIEVQQQVFCLRRLRMDGDEVIGYHTAYIGPKFTQAIDPGAFTEGGSLRYLRAQPILNTCTADRIIEAVEAGPEEAELLSVAEGAALLLIRRAIRTDEGHPVEIFRGLYRGDRFQYQISNMRAISQINA